MRHLPWRKTSSAYHIWLSEIILQQTRVDQGLKYFYAFTETFPEIKDLANAPEDQVLRLWQGLGYYNRARNLHATAKYIHKELNDTFPDNYEGLLQLKGVGDYTASAIASFAFNERVAVLDGNVFRVISRFYGLYDDIAQNASRKIFKNLLNDILPDSGEDCHTFNQSIMEFGAMLCTPKKPDCGNCPVREDCFAFSNNAQAALPVKVKKLKIRKRHFYYLLLKKNDETIALNKRNTKDIWASLYDFPMIESEQPLTEEELPDMISKKLNTKEINYKIIHSAKKHQLSHQSIFAHFIEIKSDLLYSHLSDLKDYTINEIKDLPKPILIDNFLNQFYF